MATALAIAAVARTLLRLIEQHCPRDDFTSEPGFALYHSHDFGDPPVAEGFSLMLYRVTVSASRSQPPRRGTDGVLRRPALPVDLHFLLTPWAGDAERHLRLLGWAMRFVEDHPILSASDLNHSLAQRDTPVFRADETVELSVDPPGLADYLGLWDKFKERWQTPVPYLARAVMLESEITLGEGKLVQTRHPSYGEPKPEAVR